MSGLPSSSQAFLERSGWGAATRASIAGDLSVRRYTRLSRSGDTCVLMEGATTASLDDFVEMTNWLRSIGLSAPQIIARDEGSNLLLLEDLGDAKLTSLIEQTPSAQSGFYEKIVDVLAHIAAQPSLNLGAPGAPELLEATRLVDEWYPGADTKALNALRQELGAALEATLEQPRTVSLRDFHTDNIIWLDERSDAAQVGLLDYQDAFLMPPTYDVMSLVTDARVDVPAHVRRATLESFAAKTGMNLDCVERDVAVLSVQRNLRILGIFSRAALRDGKRHHLPALPRVRGYLRIALQHPSLSAARNLLDQAVPSEAFI